MQEAVIYTDGASQGNPGRAGAGWVIETLDGNVVEEGSLPLGETTNNVAEYRAVIAALERARALGLSRLTLRSDSELLVRQLNGSYRVRSEALLPLYEQVQRLRTAFAKVNVEHVPREQNMRADALAGEAASGKGVAPKSGILTPPDRPEPAHIRVRYGETDQMGVAYYANYFDWFTEGRTELLRRRGVSYSDLERSGIFLPVREAHCAYEKSARYDDVLLIHAAVERLTPVRLDFTYEIERIASEYGDALGRIAVGRTQHVFVAGDGRPIDIRKHHPQIWQSMVRAAGTLAT